MEGFDHLPVGRGEEQVALIEGGQETGAGTGKGAGDDGGIGGQRARESRSELPGIRAAQAGDELGGGADQLVEGVGPTGGLDLGAVGGKEVGQRAVSDLELGVEAGRGKQAFGLTVAVGVEVAGGERARGRTPNGRLAGATRPDRYRTGAGR